MNYQTVNVLMPNMLQEIEALSKLDVEGIITTNWDQFLEKLFPDYKVYVGQRELIFSVPINK